MGNSGCRSCQDLETAATEKCMKHFLHYAKSVRYPDDNAFHIAAVKGYFDIISLLAQSKYVQKINIRTHSQETPLMLSIRYSNFKCSLALLRYGADLGINEDGLQNALDYALEYGTVDAVLVEIASCLSGDQLQTFFHKACKSFGKINLPILIELGADPFCCDDDGLSAFELASRCNNDEAIWAMSSHLSMEQLQNVFHSICATSNRDILSKLLKIGVDPCWRDGNYISCIDKALINHNDGAIIAMAPFLSAEVLQQVCISGSTSFESNTILELIEFDVGDSAILAMARNLSKEQIQHVFHKEWQNLKVKTVSAFVKELGADPFWRDKDNISCIDKALSNENDKAILGLASYLSQDQLQSILSFGCATLKPETVIELVKQGADPMWRDQNGISCIIKAIKNKNDGAVLEMSTHIPDGQLQNVFHIVCAHAKRKTVSKFLRMGVNPCWRDVHDISCIDTALNNRNDGAILAMAPYLSPEMLQYVCITGGGSFETETVLELIKLDVGRRAILAMTRDQSKEHIQEVLYNGCLTFDPETVSELGERDNNAISCIKRALMNNDGKIVVALAPYLSKDQLQPVFYQACKELDNSTVTELLRLGGDPFWTDSWTGFTCLMIAALSPIDARYKLRVLQSQRVYGNEPDGKVLNYLLQLEAGSQSHTLRRYEIFNMACPKGIMETFEVIRKGMQVNKPQETFAVAVSILPTFFICDLIKLNADLNSSFKDGEFAVHATVRVNSLAKFEQIVEHSKACLSLEWRGLTPIETAIAHYPSGNAMIKVMEFLNNETEESLLRIARKCKFRGESDLTFAVRIGCLKMINLWISHDNILACDDTGMCAFQLSYQHKEVYDILKQHLNCEQKEYYEKYAKQMREWYDRVENCKTIYATSTKPVIEYQETIMFLKESVLQNNESFWAASCSLFDSLIGIMDEFSSTLSKSHRYSFLAFSATKCGSLREGTKTFVPNEADIACVATNANGIKILDTKSSQSCIRVDKRNADSGWSRLCLQEDILSPKKLEVEFCDAMEYAFENTDIKPPFSAGKFSLQRKDKISCFRLLYRNDTLKDLVVTVDFIFAFPHPMYWIPQYLEDELGVHDAIFYLIPKVSVRKTLTPETAHFLVSYSDIESKFIINLQENIRIGFTYAKAARSPKYYKLPDDVSRRLLEPICVEDIITTYMLKTCLMRLMAKDLVFEDMLSLSPYDIAYNIYEELRNRVKYDGKLEFFFDPSINLFYCEHQFDIDYDDKLGCCLKRMLIVAFCEAIM